MVSSIDSRGLGLKFKAAFNLSELAGQTVLSVNGTGQFWELTELVVTEPCHLSATRQMRGSFEWGILQTMVQNNFQLYWHSENTQGSVNSHACTREGKTFAFN